ncbi:MAG: Z1 domain-containing protein [Steroidobacteraceae bacterium]
MNELTLEASLGLVRMLIDNGIPKDAALANPAIPASLRNAVTEALEREELVILRRATVIVADPGRVDWLRTKDRQGWYYWPALRQYLLTSKNWSRPAVNSLDQETDRVLAQMADPTSDCFDIRGLVIGYVQSGKTANFTALVAKAADVGYRLVIVLSGLDNGLRRQTQIRLDRELVGYAEGCVGAVRLPPVGQRWHQFTTEEFGGDFRPGHANHSALQGSQPVLLVMKKNARVLDRLHTWLDAAPEEVRNALPLLVIDDEADQASVDTRGSYQTSDPDQDYAEPAVINGLIRELLHKFRRRAYVAYTATPFANILIPHDNVDPNAGSDLYPRDFIVDLPQPDGYFGAERLFGRLDEETGEFIDGMDVIRHIPDIDIATLDADQLPDSLCTAIMDFVLAGAARAERGQGGQPATMLIHTSQRKDDHKALWTGVSTWFHEFRDEWRYHPKQGIRNRMKIRWENEFVPATRAGFIERVRSFDEIEAFIGPFLEALSPPRVVNSDTKEVLDYERDRGLKVIAIGGNRLARGLTLEGLLVSYFVRSSAQYDTLMQMGRWFGFRGGYEDLTRIWTTAELARWFADLAAVEHELRQDIRRYEAERVTPLELGIRIKDHPSMLVTSPLKQRFATNIPVAQSYSEQVVQTVRFPFSRPSDLSVLLEKNLLAVKQLFAMLGTPDERSSGDVIWKSRRATEVLGFLAQYQVDDQARSISLPLLSKYIEVQLEHGELTDWVVAVKGRGRPDSELGQTRWGISGGEVNMINRSRLRNSDTDSIGVLTSPDDELTGFADRRAAAETVRVGEKIGLNPAARRVRTPQEGLLLIYPVSRNSKPDSEITRRPLFDDPNDGRARDLVGIAVSFPRSNMAMPVKGYFVGTAGWKPA